jgi:hypothetical protein
MLFEGDLLSSRSANKGYQKTKEESDQLVFLITVTMHIQLLISSGQWQKVITESVKLITPFLKLFKKENDSLSPFCKEFTMVQEFLQTFIKYCPKNLL